MRTSATPVVVEASGISDCLDRLAARKREYRPLSTYRLQFHEGFRFTDARELVPYLYELGITHAYSSPILTARAGSHHGYDIVDHNSINPEIGTEDEFHAWVDALKEHGMGQILDIVPNHMGIGYGSNPWWQDVLENGRTSVYAEFFDIDWDPFKGALSNKVLLPILGDQYGEELERGHIRLNFENGKFWLNYYDKHLPVDPQTIPTIFEAVEELHTGNGQSPISPQVRSELDEIVRQMRTLPANKTLDPVKVAERRRLAPELKERFARLAQSSPEVRSLMERVVNTVNGTPGDSHSFDALHRLLEGQAYRLALWRVSSEEINYRRFFDINDLIGLRMENPVVFAATHKLLRRLLSDGSVNGLRIDHPDGLLNPRQYFTRVQMLFAASQCCGPEPTLPVAENGIESAVMEVFTQHDWMNNRAPLYVVAEKILEPAEELPTEWPVDGTSGYDFTNQVNGIFIDQRNERAFTNIYRRFIGGDVNPEQLIYVSKKLIMQSALASEVTVLSHVLDDISSTDRRARDFTRSALAQAIRETIASFPVYRTYIDERGEISDRDRVHITEAIVRAKRHNPTLSGAVYDFLKDILLLKTNGSDNWTDAYRKRLYFVLKFQQLNGPVMAKGVEDTVCYVYNRFVSLNEVGGYPQKFGSSIDEFHRENLYRLEHWPHSMLTTSTHDTKRSEDVRARLNVLSEMPKQWSNQVIRWRRMNRARKRILGDGRAVPDASEEYLLYQTLVGTWLWANESDEERERYITRIQQYMTKAVHEAKVNLSWVNPNPEYVDALNEFIARILAPASHGRPNHFLTSISEFAASVGFFGAINSLAQTLLKIVSPGVPDIYQGTELWDFSLVDPDNRRPVDFALRRRLLTELTSVASGSGIELCSDLLRTYQDGRIKLWTTTRALSFRSAHPELFHSGSYLPLQATGERQENVVAFSRSAEGMSMIVAVPRLAYRLTGGQPVWTPEMWGNTELPVSLGAGIRLESVFTGEQIDISPRRAISCRELFGRFPVALLFGG
jgi:(1->4)-alpha-D-glucan 1-alpha-D-glucosylmutase